MWVLASGAVYRTALCSKPSTVLKASLCARLAEFVYAADVVSYVEAKGGPYLFGEDSHGLHCFRLGTKWFERLTVPSKVEGRHKRHKKIRWMLGARKGGWGASPAGGEDIMAVASEVKVSKDMEQLASPASPRY